MLFNYFFFRGMFMKKLLFLISTLICNYAAYSRSPLACEVDELLQMAQSFNKILFQAPPEERIAQKIKTLDKLLAEKAAPLNVLKVLRFNLSPEEAQARMLYVMEKQKEIKERLDVYELRLTLKLDLPLLPNALYEKINQQIGCLITSIRNNFKMLNQTKGREKVKIAFIISCKLAALDNLTGIANVYRTDEYR